MGRFIVLEGLDGSGKTTQAKLLAEEMAKRGRIRELSFPCYGEKSASLVELYLGGGISDDPDDINGYAASTFFAADRYISYITDWKKDYDDPDCTVIATRYTTSNAYHQLSKLPEDKWDDFLKWIYDFEFVKLGLPKPDDVIVLTLDPEISNGNVRKRSGETGQNIDIHEKDSDYLDRCYKAEQYAAKEGGWINIPSAKDGKQLPVDEIFSEILKALDK